MNLVNMVGFWFYVFPQSTVAYDNASLEEAIGNSFLTQIYFLVRNYVVHTIPAFVTILNVFQSDIIFLQKDWYLMPLTSMFYLLVNFGVSQYSGK